MKIIKSHNIAFLVGITMFFVGCAVLTVDVDVYKGPLANHRDVQIEQMAAMAIGAKPLLLELRNTLEEKYNTLPPKYKHEFWPMPEDLDEEEWLKDPNAIRVNAILGLYNDSGIQDKVVLSYLDKLNANFKRLTLMRETLEPEAEQDRLFWEKYAKYLYCEIYHPVTKALNQNIEEVERERKDAERARNDAEEAGDMNKRRQHGQMVGQLGDLKKSLNDFRDSIGKQLELMQLGYQELLYPDYPKAKVNRPFRYIHTIAQAHEKIKNLENTMLKIFKTRELNIEAESIELDELIQDYSKRNSEIKDLLEDITNKEAVPEGTNARFEWLQNEGLVGAHVDFMFKKDLPESHRKDLIERVNTIGRRFIESRSVMDESLVLTLNLNEYIDNKKGEGINNASVLTDANIKLTLSLVNVESFHAAITNEQASDETIALRSKVWSILPSEDQFKISDWDRLRIQKYKNALLYWLRKEPGNTSRQLYNIHLFFKIGPYTQLKSAGKNWYGIASRRRFGISHAQTGSAQDMDYLEPLDEVLANSEDFQELRTGSGLDRGRLPQGLETLIEEYLNLAADDSTEKEKVDFARQQLSNALVRFAEKVLFMTNKKSFLQDPTKNDPGIIDGLARLTMRGLFGTPTGDIVMENKYLRILQAVGNSILVQADALQQESQHSERLKDHYEKEITILADTVSRMSPVNRNTVGIKPVDKLLPKDAKTAKDVRDVWIELLEYEHDLALYYGDTNRAKQIKEALDAARKKREEMIFIRPAMAYLRTSFPATSLQSNPNLTWDNMLGGHMLRSMPFGPQLGEFFNPDAKRDARINAEIDKQFWQNINRVRVAGGGNTNYAVVKDDIGNWYVKGYSADPCDIIDSARNLGMFSLGAKLNTDLLGRINRQKRDQQSADEPDPNQIAIGRMYNKYTEQYNSRTSADRVRLTDILENEMKSAIRQAWEQNEGLKKYVPSLEDVLNNAIQDHLGIPTQELKENKDITEQGSKIISALQAIRRFHKMLLTDIHDTITVPKGEKFLKAKEEKALKEQELNNAKEKGEEVTEKEDAFETAKGNYETAITEYDAAIRAEECSIRDVTRIVREKIMALIISRMDSVQDYETALMFIGESNTQ